MTRNLSARKVRVCDDCHYAMFETVDRLANLKAVGSGELSRFVTMGAILSLTGLPPLPDTAGGMRRRLPFGVSHQAGYGTFIEIL